MTAAEHASLEAAEAAFRRHHPVTPPRGCLTSCAGPSSRASMLGGHVYLDYTGGGLQSAPGAAHFEDGTVN